MSTIPHNTNITSNVEIITFILSLPLPFFSQLSIRQSSFILAISYTRFECRTVNTTHTFRSTNLERWDFENAVGGVSCDNLRNVEGTNFERTRESGPRATNGSEQPMAPPTSATKAFVPGVPSHHFPSAWVLSMSVCILSFSINDKPRKQRDECKREVQFVFCYFFQELQPKKTFKGSSLFGTEWNQRNWKSTTIRRWILLYFLHKNF